MKKAIVLLLSMFAGFGCKKNQLERPYYQFAAEGLAYIQLPVNRYYIYQDSATGAMDSVVVVTSSLEKVFVPAQGDLFNGNIAYYYQFYTLKLKSTKTTNFWLSSTASAGNSDLFSLDTHHNGLPYSVFRFPIYPFISSMVVHGVSYVNIERYELDYQSPVLSESISVIYYWAKGVGIIKRQVKTGGMIRTESLIRHG